MDSFRLGSQDPYGGSQPSVPPVPGKSVPLVTSAGTRQTQNAHMYKEAKHAHKVKNQSKTILNEFRSILREKVKRKIPRVSATICYLTASTF